MRRFFIKNNNYGFTLVEMMVAIAVFSVVMVAAMGALLNVIDADNKAKNIKVAVNNLSFALEGISKDMRMGTEYGCSLNLGASFVGGCFTGGNTIRYKSPRADPTGGFVYYRFNNSRLEECLDKGQVCDPYNGPYSPITSGEVTLTSVKFYIYGVDHSLDVDNTTRTQPRMIMTVSGTAGATRVKTKTDFDLQTSVSQRIRP